jgi:hypothetical protein
MAQKTWAIAIFCKTEHAFCQRMSESGNAYIHGWRKFNVLMHYPSSNKKLAILRASLFMIVTMANTSHAVTIHAMDGKSAIIAISECSSASQWYVVHLQPSKTDRE